MSTTITARDHDQVDDRRTIGRAVAVLLATVAIAMAAGCSDDDDSGGGDGSGGTCAEIFAIGGSAPADTAAFVVESPGAQGPEVAGAVECEGDDGETGFRTVFRFDCDDGSAVYYASLGDAGFAAWEDGGSFFEVPVSPGPGASNLCI